VRCDLHVHSLRSTEVDLPVLRHFGRECYSEPQAVYDLALRRGMNLVTLTDHDTIEGALEIASRPNTFVSEEVTVSLQGGRELHIGALDITEKQHHRIAHLRKDAEALFAYLAEQKIPAVIHHLFSALTGNRETGDFSHALKSGLGLIEGRNGMMSQRINEYAVRAGQEAGLASVGGSDAHTLASVASAFTIVEGAENREEFLAGLRRGCVIPGGAHGNYAKLTRDVALLFSEGYRESATSLLHGGGAFARFGVLVLALPLLPLLPLVTAAIYTHERLFADRHYSLFRSSPSIRGRGQGPSGAWSAASSPVQP
jgi:predicted metal-dependent phosphoesterase TrpH